MQSTTIHSFYSIEIANGIVTAHVTKRITVDEFKALFIDMKQQALDNNINKLLADGSSVDFNDVSIIERHAIGLVAAELLKGDFKAVLILKEQHINKHGENVANNRGAQVLVTHSLAEAHEWLLK